MRDALEGDLEETGRREDAAASRLVGFASLGGSTDDPTELPDVPGAGVCESLAGRAT